jgi:hypothetical protein
MYRFGAKSICTKLKKFIKLFLILFTTSIYIKIFYFKQFSKSPFDTNYHEFY